MPPKGHRSYSDTLWFIDLLTRETNSEYRERAVIHHLDGSTPRPRVPSAIAAFVSFLLVGIGFGAAALLTSQTRPALDSTRLELVERVTDMQSRVEAVEYTNGRLRSKNAQLVSQIQPIDNLLAGEVRVQSAYGGYKATSGRGIKIFIRDRGSEASRPSELLIDADLQIIVNGLWASGARAIEINNVRLTGGTNIRNAGEAILIDYVPISSPYTIKAIGPVGLRHAFDSSAAAAWVEDLVANYPIDVQFTSRRSIKVKAGRMPSVEYAERFEQ